ncbi:MULTISPECIES: maleylpyruvate isomerase family mycothiol-dependent enzyme [unclassified Mycolicibacterium]|uniref:maleylpyruvate isomerase family mycothiol-dependent enzyme n=1 Tax=unclassified Mycolicibacterium TaxID=2636767 RepID=UPI0012DF7557|nr:MULTISPECIES: maleylpyruvate isomerase family mycothiol-dependent enzyme [unclassified Mycolicibacterium]MUL82072.1 maleylpyruvate isomerase family mycothiol-dependent enzyme [Mycolicibacterium sp. CBMA 329]MUL87838.1 maleylpyruvate isomerase family mycothiol-dependent enzyme [Mycolicibacterium sp. CBMA 331]MUM01661.1 maleylpyruvate isomerase family mycothiol-dependent enzyme [Mycolicibacterium sp. CBMA 334]MUM25506.1 maleylpyruvate isomerase family mycothiol-dependent enzyme [Mycolicibacter
MDSDTIWRNIDEQRVQLADLLDTLQPHQWSTASLCTGWTVREVAVHLTQSQLSRADLVRAALKSGFRFNAMVRRMALTDPADPPAITARLRGMVGSRQRPPMAKEIDPLLDVLVHTQDICVPLGVDRPMPVDAAVAVAERLWHMKFPFAPQRDLPGYRFAATDTDFAVGPQWGARREAPIRDIVMMFARRRDVPDAEPETEDEAD